MTDLFYNIAIDCLDQPAIGPRTGNKTAMIYVKEENETLLVSRVTFRDFYTLANRFANGLLNQGARAGDRMILRLPNSPAFAISFLGALKTKIIPIPTSPLLTATELKHIIEDSGVSVLVTTVDLIPSELPESVKIKIVIGREIHDNSRGIFSWDEMMENASDRFRTEKTKADDPAFWLYTSGTEGTPKGVIHAHRSIPAHDPRLYDWQDFQEGDVVFNTSSLNWSYALTGGLLDLWRHGGTTIIYSGKPEPEKILRIIHDQGVTTFMSVPGIYRMLVEHFKSQGVHPSLPDRLRVCLSAGEKLSPEVRESFEYLTGKRIYEGLGMTEHSVYLVQPFGSDLVPGSCGRPLAGSKVAILREDLTEAPPSEVGILASHRSCPGLMLGYYGYDEDVFHGDWFLSGDLASCDQEGNFFFVSRRDDVITAGGYRISPLEVETVLNSHPTVLESAVIGKEEEPGKTVVWAYVVLQRDGAFSAEELMAHANQQLAKYKVPRKIFFVNSLPKTRNGKIRRQDLLKPPIK